MIKPQSKQNWPKRAKSLWHCSFNLERTGIFFQVVVVERFHSYALSLLRHISWKLQKVFGPVKPFLDRLYLKTEKCIHLKLLVWRGPPFIFRICEWNCSVITRFAILQWLYGPEKLPGLLRNGPLHCTLDIWNPGMGGGGGGEGNSHMRRSGLLIGKLKFNSERRVKCESCLSFIRPLIDTT